MPHKTEPFLDLLSGIFLVSAWFYFGVRFAIFFLGR